MDRLQHRHRTDQVVRHRQRHTTAAGISVRGRAFLKVVLRSTTTAAAPGRPTALRTTLTTRLDEVAQLRKAGELEAVVTYVIGLHERHPFRVVTLRQPYRLAVDVRH